VVRLDVQPRRSEELLGHDFRRQQHHKRKDGGLRLWLVAKGEGMCASTHCGGGLASLVSPACVSCVDSRAFWSQAFDMAYMLNGKFALKHDPTLTGRHTGKYL